MRAMIVDDSRATRAILGRILQEIGFEVLTAADGREALEMLATEADVSLALVDWNMPVMNGLDFVQAVRADRVHDGMRLIMVTTESDADRMVAALQMGADEYAMKPFTAAVIREKLDILGITVVGDGA